MPKNAPGDGNSQNGKLLPKVLQVKESKVMTNPSAGDYNFSAQPQTPEVRLQARFRNFNGGREDR